MSKKIALIDADGIAYRAAAANNEVDSFEHMRDIVRESINFIVSATNATHAILFVKGDRNFRKDIATIKPYKGNRVPVPIKWLDPVYYILTQELNAVRAHGAEADDYIASMARVYRDLGVEHVVCSHDKDLYQIPGEHFDLNSLELSVITPNDAAYRLYFQILTGDSSDNIQGLPKIGEKTAEKILAATEQSEQGYMQATINAYQNVYGEIWPQMFAENYRLVLLSTRIDLDGIEDASISSFTYDI